jgi:hypothetical protein
MVIGVNNLHQIKQIHQITSSDLKQIEIDESSPDYPFKNWTDERILCYCYKQAEQGISVYPYVDPNKISEFENSILILQAEVVELEYQKALEVIKNV